MKKMKLFLFLLLVGSGWLRADEALQSNCRPEVREYLTQAMISFQNRLDGVHAQSAYSQIQMAAQNDAQCLEARVLGSEIAWWMGADTENRKEKLGSHQQGIDWAREAIQIDSNSAAAHYWLAVNYGSFGEAKGVMKSLFLVKPMRQELNNVLRLDPAHQKGGAHRLLGIMDYKVPGMAGGSKRRSLTELTQALSLGPSDPFNLYYIAEYHAIMDQPEQARIYLDQLAALPTTDSNGPYVVLMQRKGRVLAGELPQKN